MKSLCRLLTTLENHSLDTARVATDKEKAMKCARAIETATQKKRALELAQERKFQVSNVLKTLTDQWLTTKYILCCRLIVQATAVAQFTTNARINLHAYFCLLPGK